jgi:uncharacterized membrane protein
MVSDRRIPLDRYGPAWMHVTISLLFGVVVGLTCGLLWRGVAPFGALIGWDAGAGLYVAWTWLSFAHLDPDRTAAMVTRDDPSRPIVETILGVAGIASLAAVVVVIVHAGQVEGVAKGLQTALGIGSVVASWLVVHTSYTLRYAKLYYTGDDTGIDFNQQQPPRFTDFAYLAFTIGMTFQVSDTDIQTSDIRATALRHGLLSYLYGTVIIATAINLVAGLAK